MKYMNCENIDNIPYVNDETIEELATLYNMGELEVRDIQEDIQELIINDLN